MWQNHVTNKPFTTSGLADYNNLNIFGKGLFQPEYHILKKAFEEKLPKDVIIRLFENQNEITDLGISPLSIAEEMAKEVRDKSNVHCNFYQLTEDVANLRDLSPEKKNLMVFDDLLLEKQNICELYYVRGRHSNVDFSIQLKTISSFHVKQSERTWISYVCFSKTQRT